jgi:outer membrane immunogenic protein
MEPARNGAVTGVEWGQSMSRLSSLVLAAVLAAAPAAANAADQFDTPAAVASSTFDWNGFYAGVHGVAQSSPLGGTQAGIEINLGAAAQFEFVLVGAEVAVHFLGGGAGNSAYAQTLARIGVAATDDIVLYGASGLGLDMGPVGGTDALLGGGVELALTENMSVRGQYVHGFDLTGANPKDQVSIGANFHF